MNVVVINSDTFRRSNLACYGGDWVRTPCLGRFAERATVFERYYVASFPTIPNRTDAFTGRYHFTEGYWQPLDRQIPVLAQALTQSGYVTQLLCDTPHLLNKGFHFDRGFEGAANLRGHEDDHYLTAANLFFDLPCDPRKLRNAGWLRRHKANFRDRRAEEDWPVARLMRLAERWLEDNWRAEKFFLWVDAFDPHEPWDAPRALIESYDPGYEGEEVPLPNYAKCDYLSKDELKHCRALYAAEATLVDRWVGRLLDKIAEYDLWENTMVAFTTDHGFYLGEHGYIGKHTLDPATPWPLYDDLARIPLLVWAPKAGRPKRIDEIVQPPDLMPTILEAAGARAPETVQGRSFLPLLEGSGEPLHEVAISCGQFTPAGGRTTITSKNRQLVYGHPSAPAELYRIGAQGIEGRNIFAEARAEAEGLRDTALKFLSSLGTSEEKLAPLRSLEC